MSVNKTSVPLCLHPPSLQQPRHHPPYLLGEVLCPAPGPTSWTTKTGGTLQLQRTKTVLFEFPIGAHVPRGCFSFSTLIPFKLLCAYTQTTSCETWGKRRRYLLPIVCSFTDTHIIYITTIQLFECTITYSSLCSINTRCCMRRLLLSLGTRLAKTVSEKQRL